MRRFLLVLAVAVLGFVSLPSGARALGLDILSSGGSLTSGNGVLTFDDFDVITNGSVRSDLSLYDVQALVDGIAITGPISAAGGSVGDLFIQFSVSSTEAIRGATLRFNGAAVGRGASASVTETYEELEDAQLFVFASGGIRDLSDAIRFGPDGPTSLRVSKDILVDSGRGGPRPRREDDHPGRHLGWKLGKGHDHHGEPDLRHLLDDDDCDEHGRPRRGKRGVAVISRIEQRFVTAPEPAALLLLGTALAGLAIARKRLA